MFFLGKMSILKFVLIFLIFFTGKITSFYIPGVAPTEYEAKENVEIKVTLKFLLQSLMLT